jgi:hypothetical protein
LSKLLQWDPNFLSACTKIRLKKRIRKTTDLFAFSKKSNNQKFQKKIKKKPDQSNFCQKEDQPVSDQNFHKYFSNLDQDSTNFELKEDQANLDQDSINSQNIQKRIRNKKKRIRKFCWYQKQTQTGENSRLAGPRKFSLPLRRVNLI